MVVFTTHSAGLCSNCSRVMPGMATSVQVGPTHLELCSPCSDELLQELAYRKERKAGEAPGVSQVKP